MSNGLGESSVIALAGNNVMQEIIRHSGPAKPHVVNVRNEGDVALLITADRIREQVTRALILDDQINVSNEATGYTGTGSQILFFGNSLAAAQGAIVPGSVQVDTTTTSPAMRDVDLDGVLWQQAGARKRGVGGFFSAMSNESFSVKIDGGAEQTITLGTEATIVAAVATINGQLVGATALEQGAQNVDITSDLLGKGSSVEVTAADPALAVKLGIVQGLATNQGGTIDYFSGALSLGYQGYPPANAEAITADYVTTPEISPNEGVAIRIPQVSDLDLITISAQGNGGTPKLIADLVPMNRNTR